MSDSGHRPLDPAAFGVAWIAPLPIEMKAAEEVADEIYHDGYFEVPPGDKSLYSGVRMGRHNVVIATLSAGCSTGTVAAAILARSINAVFPAIQFGLVVGICGAAPDLNKNPPWDIRLGDVLVGYDTPNQSAVVSYEAVKVTRDGEQPRGHGLPRTNRLIGAAISRTKLHSDAEEEKMRDRYNRIQAKDASFAPPQDYADVLWASDAAGQEVSVQRPPREKQSRVWYCTIISGSKLIKTNQARDEISNSYGGAGFEMEAAGVLEEMPAAIVRGVSDYADRHKSDHWQPYAAARAASCAKQLLHQIVFKEPSKSPYLGLTALVGLSGVGKTEIALELSHRIKDNDERSVFWVSLETEKTMKRDFGQICSHLRLRNQDQVQVVCEYLASTNSGRWLLVLDNIDYQEKSQKSMLEKLSRLLPNRSESMILFLSRSIRVQEYFAVSDFVRLYNMEHDDAVDLLTAPAFSLPQEHLDQLVDQLQCFPRALVEAATFLNANSSHVTVRDYVELIRNCPETLMSLLNQAGPGTRSLAGTWKDAFGAFAAPATRLLSFLCCIEPGDIPATLFQRVDKSNNDLFKSLFLTGALANTVFNMNPLVHTVARDWLREQSQDHVEHATREAIVHIIAQFPQDGAAQLAHLPHAFCALRCLDGLGGSLTTGARTLMQSAGDRFRELRQFRQALWCYEKLCNQDEPPQDAVSIRCLLQLGAVQTDGEQLSMAIKNLESALEQARRILPSNHELILAIQHELGRALSSAECTDRAIAVLEGVVDARKTLPLTSSERLSSEHELARALMNRINTQDMLRMSRRAITDRREPSGDRLDETDDDDDDDDDDDSHVSRRHQIRRVLHLMVAVALQRKSILPPTDYNRLASQHELSRVYLLGGYKELAAEEIHLVVQAQQWCLRADDPAALLSRYQLALVHLAGNDQGIVEARKVDEALQLLYEVAEAQRRVLPLNHAATRATEQALRAVHESYHLGP
ncbi:hypothetical protein PWT90_09313 [Aphanocladium album]|nr:hypothetical protein PWT90_09313 [Aphanocladium album]